MSNKWIYDKVNQLIKKYNTRDPETLIKELNINLIYMQATNSLLGMYKVILKNRYIFIPNNLGSLKKMVIAHELGHDQLHRQASKKGATFHENKIFNPINKFETEANIFAAHLLIPDENIFSILKDSTTDTEFISELNIDLNLLNLKISELEKMNLLQLDRTTLNHLPDSVFLKTYKPLDNDWIMD